jgi:dynein heavy chain
MGNSKRKETTAAEEMITMRTLRDMNMSKFVADDVPLFESLLKDIFPKTQNPAKKIYKREEDEMNAIFADKKLIANPEFFLKCVQLYETSLVRHGFMLVGPTGCGKTTIMSTLTGALSKIPNASGNCVPYRMVRFNPKSFTSQQMFGVKDPVTDDWTPGVFAVIWEKSNKSSNNRITWIVADGPVDAIWIENLNTVLDDNKILTLANNDRIKMTDNCKITFEVENLNNASLATVSRVGVVYISAADLGYKP